MRKAFATLILVAACCSCSGNSLQEQTLAQTQSGRFKTISDQTWKPDGATCHILVIQDSLTEREFMVITSGSTAGQGGPTVIELRRTGQ